MKKIVVLILSVSFVSDTNTMEKNLNNLFRNLSINQPLTSAQSGFNKTNSPRQEVLQYVQDIMNEYQTSHICALALIKSPIALQMLQNEISKNPTYAQSEFAKLISSDEPFASEIIQEFIKAGINIDYIDENINYTPLMLAALKNNASLIELLIRARADSQISNASGHTAKSLASEETKILFVRRQLQF